jgi:hypothetical protein
MSETIALVLIAFAIASAIGMIVCIAWLFVLVSKSGSM